MRSNEYVIALRRDRRDDAPAQWLQRLAEVEGVSVVGSSPRRARVLANDAGIERVRSTLGSYLHIEPVMAHQIQ